MSDMENHVFGSLVLLAYCPRGNTDGMAKQVLITAKSCLAAKHFMRFENWLRAALSAQ